MNSIFNKLVCPTCKMKVGIVNSTIECLKCHSTWPIVNGIPCFIKDEFYWGEVGLSREEMISLNNGLAKEYWKDVLRKHYSSKIRGYYYFYTNLSRASWYKLLLLPKESIVLDVGAGMGTISDALSRVYENVVSLEPVLERVNFMQKRFEQENLTNIEIIRSNISTMPFPKNSFDLVVLNGILEWLPLSDRKKNPQKTQLGNLQKLYDIIKPKRFLYIGIENRIYYRFFLGAQDPHVPLKYVTIMPRKLADIYSKIKTGEPYLN